MYTVTYTREATKTLRKLPRDAAQRILAKISQYTADPSSQGNNVLTEHPGSRLRVGDWRVLFLTDDGEMVVTVVKIGARGGIYG